MVKGPKSYRQVLALLRKAARDKGRVVEQVVDPKTGKPRGKGSHEVWALYDGEGRELARGALTRHTGEMSWIVTRSVEEAFEAELGEGWMDQ
ncbi:MAG TPA: hypothetical protein VMV17_18775 [Streptosporangiaceae bacterium]|nr:hypothetical protein [Streptosporangiaceae bacterium]